jgi:hypothetical protein
MFLFNPKKKVPEETAAQQKCHDELPTSCQKFMLQCREFMLCN